MRALIMIHTFFLAITVNAAGYVPYGKPVLMPHGTKLTFTPDSKALVVNNYQPFIVDVATQGVNVNWLGGRLPANPIAVWIQPDLKLTRWLTSKNQIEWTPGRDRADFASVVTGHSRYVNVGAGAFSADGKVAITGSYRGLLVLTNTHSGRQLKRIQTPWAYPIIGLDFRAGTLLATSRKRLYLYDSGTAGQPLFTLRVMRPPTKGLLSPRGASFLIGYQDGGIEIRGNKAGTLLKEEKQAHVGGIADLAYRSDGGFATIGRSDGLLKIWDAKGQPIQTIKSYAGMYTVAISANGKFLVVRGLNPTSRRLEIQFFEFK